MVRAKARAIWGVWGGALSGVQSKASGQGVLSHRS